MFISFLIKIINRAFKDERYYRGFGCNKTAPAKDSSHPHKMKKNKTNKCPNDFIFSFADRSEEETLDGQQTARAR